MKLESHIIQGNDFLFSPLSRFLNPVSSSHIWKLCYRASAHGWSSSTFHTRCDGKPNTVTIIRKNQYVFGGYTDIAWGMYTVNKMPHLNNWLFIANGKKRKTNPPLPFTISEGKFRELENHVHSSHLFVGISLKIYRIIVL